MEIRDLETAQHEAAHVVVGCAVGLRLRAAVVREEWDPHAKITIAGAAYFCGRAPREAWALMYAAGIAWDEMIGAPAWWHEIDERWARKHVNGPRGLIVVTRAATAMLAGLTREHARVTRALMERDLSGADIAAMARGEAIDDT